MEASLPDGDYRARTVEPGGIVDFRIEDGIIPEIVFNANGPSLGAGVSRGVISARNTGTAGHTLVIEDRRWAADALTAHEGTTMQAFRDLVATTWFRPGDHVELLRVT